MLLSAIHMCRIAERRAVPKRRLNHSCLKLAALALRNPPIPSLTVRSKCAMGQVHAKFASTSLQAKCYLSIIHLVP